MVYNIISHHTCIITQNEAAMLEWVKKLDRLTDCVGYLDVRDLIAFLCAEYHLSENQIAHLENLLQGQPTKSLRYRCTKYEHFTIEPVSLDIRHVEGKLIDWQDWDYIFQQVDDEFHLWCYLGGIADLAREIKLSHAQIADYQASGLGVIDGLVANLQNIQFSSEYEAAIADNRRIL